jgi:hypothetical protein
MEGIQLSTFQEEVCKTTCRFYHQLKPVMVNRPNVRPWATNDDSDSSDSVVENENESLPSVEECEDGNDNNTDSDMEVLHVQPATTVANQREPEGMVVVPSDNDSHTIASLSVIDNTQDDSVSILTNNNTPETTSVSKSTSTKKRKSTKITPSEAKKKHKTLLRQGKKQISSTKSKSKIAALLEAEQEDRNFMMQSRKDKIVFETKRHNEMKEIEKQKLGIEERRFRMDEQQMLAQTEINKQKLLLAQMEVFEKREMMKKKNPHINESEIDRRFNL